MPCFHIQEHGGHLDPIRDCSICTHFALVHAQYELSWAHVLRNGLHFVSLTSFPPQHLAMRCGAPARHGARLVREGDVVGGAGQATDDDAQHAPPPYDPLLGTMIRHPLRPRGTRVRNPCCRWDAGSEPVLHEVMGYHGWGGRRNA